MSPALRKGRSPVDRPKFWPGSGVGDGEGEGEGEVVVAAEAVVTGCTMVAPNATEPTSSAAGTIVIKCLCRAAFWPVAWKICWILRIMVPLLSLFLALGLLVPRA